MNLRKTLLLFLMPLLLLTGCGNDLAITVTYSDTHNLISGPDATVVYPGKLRDGAEYYYAPSGQLQAFIRRSLDVVQEDEALDDAQLERHARDFLAQLGFPEEDFWVQDTFSNDSGQQLLFENPDQDALRVFLQKNGQVSSLNVWDHERFAPKVTARQKAYFDRALQQQLDARENTAFLVSQSVSYQKLGGVLYASYSLTYKEQTYFTQEMSFGIRVIPIPALIGIVAGVIVLLALGVWLLRRRRKQKNIG